ncbi:MAG: response regulator [Anaerolineales bacterium]|nr:response regulator [Anaerolineales bacterium]
MTKRYNLRNIRTLLTEGFTDEELRRLCYDVPDFRQVYDSLAQDMGKGKIIDRLLEHAERKLKLDILLALAKDYNPARYEEHQPYYSIPTSTSVSRAHPQMKSQGPRILIVDDDPDIVIFASDRLEHLGFQVQIARNGIEGLKKTRTEKPDLLILDVMMPEMDGYEVCRQLKADPETRQIPILMLTAKGQLPDKVRGFDIGADDYLAKPYENAELEARVKALLKRSISSPPFAAPQSDCILSISCRPTHHISVRVSGVVVFNATSRGMFDIDIEAYARQGDNTPLLDWRFNSKQWGKQLYQETFVSHPEILSNYNQALGEVGGEEKFHLRFESPRDLLRVPWEFLFDGVNEGGDYLVLRHPLARAIIGVRVKQRLLSPDFFNDLWAKGDELRILLVASNTYPDIPGVDQEIKALGSSLKMMFEERGILAQVTMIPTKRATYENVRDTLQKCKYHIVHYAGHGTFDKQSPENSYLSFWEKGNRRGIVKKMPISELQMLLRGSDLRFFYLSSCLGTKTGEPAKLLDDDFLGIADGIIHAGVPAVLGFRWPVSDDGAKALALAFYKSLANQGKIDTALLHARCETAARNRDNITWLSPILIMQA